MFLHLGNDTLIRTSQVIGIFNANIIEKSQDTKDMVEFHRSEGSLTDVSPGRAKTFILTDDAVYMSPISPSTLLKRSK